jgi:large subunit ribosomal protein L22
MEAIARVRNLRGSARKARLVLDQIRGKDIDEARKILAFSQKRVSHNVQKLLKSAVATVTENESKANLDTYFVSQAFADDGPIMRRTMPRAMGRANIIRKRTCHITLALSQREDTGEDREAKSTEADRANKTRKPQKEKKTVAQEPVAQKKQPVNEEV